jgi:hypothetical protein
MAMDRIDRWLTDLGYAEHDASLFRLPDEVPLTHRYAPELRALLDPNGLIRVKAVFDVDGTPTVAFVESVPGQSLDAIRQCIWNQSLVTIVLELARDHANVFSPQRALPPIALDRADARVDGPWSASDVQSGDVVDRAPTWFASEYRVDHDLLRNLGTAVAELRAQGMSRDAAQYLVGQVLFVSYLEHRGVIGEVYRTDRKVKPLASLIDHQDRAGLTRLFAQLKIDFNGDFLDPAVGKEAGWASLSQITFDLLARFLSRVDMETGQGSLWNYDFRLIPVELLSGIYETFLGDEKDELGAFYTPRHLAQLAVDFAFEGVVDPTQETVYDGACGSGILLTTAFRRMLAHAHAAHGVPLSLVERIALLKERIFGSDVSEPACRVTAFSLYLSLLEDLVPRDMAELMDDPGLKLPPLLHANLRARSRKGEQEGDFFADINPFAGRQHFSILISNPPWREADLSTGADQATKELGYEAWARREHRTVVRRQIAAAYAQRALDCVRSDGRVVLILPVSLLLAPTSQPFLVDWLARVRPERIVNFGDMRRQLFAEADHGCAVVVGRPRDRQAPPRVPIPEHFEYWVPKVDISLAFGRLTLHTSDRARVQTQAAMESNAVLRHRAWGTAADERLIHRLVREGTVADLCQLRAWTVGKGFNRQRHNSPKLSPARLRKMRYLDARKIPRDLPIVPDECFERFPSDITSVVSYGSQDGIAFHGPRVLYPDGLSGELEMRAVFVGDDCCFKHTIASIGGPPEDEDLLRFLAIYLRSPLMRYVILHTAYSPANERERITVREVDALPIRTPDTKERRAIVTKVAAISRAIDAQQGLLLRQSVNLKAAFSLVEKYMGLTDAEAALVHDIAEWALPSRQGTQNKLGDTIWQGAPTAADIVHYATTLQRELHGLRDAHQGHGTFSVQVHTGRTVSQRGVGVVEVCLDPKGKRQSVAVKDEALDAVGALIETLAKERLLPMKATDNLFLSTDVCVIHGNRAFLVKPLVRRLWRAGQAAEDADRIVLETTTEGVA